MTPAPTALSAFDQDKDESDEAPYRDNRAWPNDIIRPRKESLRPQRAKRAI